MSVKSEIIRQQKGWARRCGMDPDEHGYLETYDKNLFQPLNEQSRFAFEKGSGSELGGGHTGRAKMSALHSSSALAVNFFDFWVGNDTTPLAEVLELESKPLAIRFEGQFPTGLPGNPPNLDVVLDLRNDLVVGIESKFTEWLQPKSASKLPFKEKYFSFSTGVWEKVGLPETQRIAEEIQAGLVSFRHLDAPQLAKHALGLATYRNAGFRLLYVYFDSNGSEAEEHRKEIGLFAERLGSELGFKAFSYQHLIERLECCSGVALPYLEYLRARYG